MADTNNQIDDFEVEIYNDGFRDGYQQALSELNSKKFEKITRCKDCKKEALYRRHWDKDEDWFCADGEPKEGEK